MAEEKSILEQLVAATGKLHNSASAVEQSQRKMREALQRENAISPESTNGDIEPED